MLTVKHVTNIESHQFWETDCVHVSAPEVQNVDYRREVSFTAAGSGVRIQLSHGTVYIMNEAGKTVQRYELVDEKPVKTLAETRQEAA